MFKEVSGVSCCVGVDDGDRFRLWEHIEKVLCVSRR